MYLSISFNLSFIAIRHSLGKQFSNFSIQTFIISIILFCLRQSISNDSKTDKNVILCVIQYSIKGQMKLLKWGNSINQFFCTVETKYNFRLEIFYIQFEQVIAWLILSFWQYHLIHNLDVQLKSNFSKLQSTRLYIKWWSVSKITSHLRKFLGTYKKFLELDRLLSGSVNFLELLKEVFYSIVVSVEF